MYRDLNFLVRDSRLRFLQAGTLVAVLASIGMGALLINGGFPGSATIADTLASASFSVVSPSGLPGVSPLPLSDTAAAAVSNAPGMDVVRYYERNTGTAFSVALVSRRVDALRGERSTGFVDAVWIPGTRKVISSYEEPGGLVYRLHDYDAATDTVFGDATIRAVSVSPDGLKVAVVMKTAADASSISISDISGGEPRTLLSTRADELFVSWRTNDSLSVISRRNDRPGYDLSLLDLNGALTVVLKNKEGLSARWSPDGLYLLYSSFVSDTGISLWLRSFETAQEISLGIPTSASKCAWHPLGYVLTCGIPMDTSLIRDVVAEETATIDDIVTLNLDAATYHRAYKGVRGALFSVSKPIISSSGQWLVFTNTFDSRIYTIPVE